MKLLTRFKAAIKAFKTPNSFIDKSELYNELRQSIKNPEYLPEVLKESVNYAQHTAGLINSPLPYSIEADNIEDDKEFFGLCISVSRIIDEFLRSAEASNISNNELATPEKLKAYYASKD